jgi:hypothetical protein
MRTERNGSVHRGPLWLTMPLAILITISSCAGLLLPSTYARETPLGAAGGLAADVANLCILPVLVTCAILAWRGSLAAHLVWMGGLLFYVYEFVIYSLEVHFNALFLAYCSVLGLSCYAFVWSLPHVWRAETPWARNAPALTSAVILLILSLATAAQEIREIVAAQLAGQPPASIANTGQATSPIHVLDLSLLLPSWIVIAVMLLRRRPAGLVLAPVMLAFIAMMGGAVAGMGVFLVSRGFPGGYGMIVPMAVVGAGAVLLLVRFVHGSWALSPAGQLHTT